MPHSSLQALREIMKSRALIVDGGMGTMILDLALAESEYRGSSGGFRDWPLALKGNHDLLNITQPERIQSIHYQYGKCGADILETNTLSAQRISQKAFGTVDFVKEINREGARVCRLAADLVQLEKGRRVFVAGSLGPTTVMATYAPIKKGEPLFFDVLVDAYEEQAKALLEGGVDLFMIETIVDTINSKAALRGVQRALLSRSGDAAEVEAFPIILSATPVAEGRTISGERLGSWYAALRAICPSLLAVGVNCGGGPNDESLREALRALQCCTAPDGVALVCYPNAGLPNAEGGYDITPESFTAAVLPLVATGLADIVGGCCGTTPEHIRALSSAVHALPPRPGIEQRRTSAAKLEPRGTISGMDDTISLGCIDKLTVQRVVLQADAANDNVDDTPMRANHTESHYFHQRLGSSSSRSSQHESSAPQALPYIAEAVWFSSTGVSEDKGNALSIAVQRISNDSSDQRSRLPVILHSASLCQLEAGVKSCRGRPMALFSLSAHHTEEFIERAVRLLQEYGAAIGLVSVWSEAEDMDDKVEMGRWLLLLDVLLHCRSSDLVLFLSTSAATPFDAHHSEWTNQWIRWREECAPDCLLFIEDSSAFNKKHPTIETLGEAQLSTIKSH